MATVNHMRPLNLIWHKLGSVRLTVVLCLMLAADLTLGYLCLQERSSLFAPMNDVGLAAWSGTYGRQNLMHTAWFFMLLALLALLCINTFVCTTDRVTALLRRQRRLGAQRLIFKLAPHLMHYALIVVLCGYLCSYLFAQVLDTRTLVPGSAMTLPNTTARIAFESFDPVYYTGDRLPGFTDRVLQPRARLALTEGTTHRHAVLTLNRPVRFKGYGIFLKQFSPKTKPDSGMGMGQRERIDVSIRKDPGVWLYMAGIVVFILGLGVYCVEWGFFRRSDR